MPVTFKGKRDGLVMSRGEIFKATREDEQIFPVPQPEDEEESSSEDEWELALPPQYHHNHHHRHHSELLPAHRLAAIEYEERRPRHSSSSRLSWVAVEAAAPSPRRFEVPPASQYTAYAAGPAPLLLPPPIPQPVVAQPYPPPPPAPEVSILERRRRRSTREGEESSSSRHESRRRHQHRYSNENNDSLRVEVPHHSRRHSRGDSQSSVLSAGTSSSSRSQRSSTSVVSRGRSRNSFDATPATSPSYHQSRGRKQTRMIEEPKKGPKHWSEQLSLRDEVVYKNSDGTKTKQFYYS